MSLFIRATNTNEPNPQIFRIRDLHTTIGYSESGKLTSENPFTPLFSIQQRESYFLSICSPEVVLDGIKQIENDEIALKQAHSLHTPQASFEIICTSSKSEAQRKECIKQFSSFTAHYVLGPLRKTIPIPLDSPLTIGSSIQADLFMPIPGIEAMHCKLQLLGDNLHVEQLDGDAQLTQDTSSGYRVSLPSASFSITVTNSPL